DEIEVLIADLGEPEAGGDALHRLRRHVGADVQHHFVLDEAALAYGWHAGEAALTRQQSPPAVPGQARRPAGELTWAAVHGGTVAEHAAAGEGAAAARPGAKARGARLHAGAVELLPTEPRLPARPARPHAAGTETVHAARAASHLPAIGADGAGAASPTPARGGVARRPRSEEGRGGERGGSARGAGRAQIGGQWRST